MSDSERRMRDLWVWSQVVEAVRALDAVEGSLPPEEDAIAQRLLREADALRATMETRILGPLGITPRPPIP
jgi:hypothetical protein